MTRKRSWLVWGLVVVATILLLVSSLTIWTKRQLLDNKAWTDSSARLLQDDAIRTTLSNRLSELLNERIDIKSQLQQQLPPRLQPVAPVVAAAAQNATSRILDAFLQTSQAQTLWKDANSRAHTAIVNVLEGKNAGPVSTANGNVVLDLRPMIGQIAARIGVADKLKAHAPPTAGEIVLLKSKQLKTAQRAVRILRVLTIFLVLVVLGLYVLAVYLARGRRRVVLEGIGLGLVITGLILIIVRRVTGNYIVGSLVKVDANKPAVQHAWAIETSLMRDLAIALLVYGILTILAGFVAGPSRAAVAIRRWLAPAFRDHVVIVYVVAATLFLIFIAFGPTGGSRRWFGTLVLAVLFFAGIEVWRRQTVREFPGDEKPAVETPSTPSSTASH
ncbi:MAG TPA: hypothetical protein VEH52_01590 [Gaiellaceae bacterium]|nr:hypothetical protein [Gaiellaceae bacterium]